MWYKTLPTFNLATTAGVSSTPVVCNKVRLWTFLVYSLQLAQIDIENATRRWKDGLEKASRLWNWVPSSCGNCCETTATPMLRPRRRLSENAAPKRVTRKMCAAVTTDRRRIRIGNVLTHAHPVNEIIRTWAEDDHVGDARNFNGWRVYYVLLHDFHRYGHFTVALLKWKRIGFSHCRFELIERYYRCFSGRWRWIFHSVWSCSRNCLKYNGTLLPLALPQIQKLVQINLIKGNLSFFPDLPETYRYEPLRKSGLVSKNRQEHPYSLAFKRNDLLVLDTHPREVAVHDIQKAVPFLKYLRWMLQRSQTVVFSSWSDIPSLLESRIAWKPLTPFDQESVRRHTSQPCTMNNMHSWFPSQLTTKKKGVQRTHTGFAFSVIWISKLDTIDSTHHSNTTSSWELQRRSWFRL